MGICIVEAWQLLLFLVKYEKPVNLQNASAAQVTEVAFCKDIGILCGSEFSVIHSRSSRPSGKQEAEMFY